MVNKILIVALIGLTGIAQAADLYKWTDDKGVTHYSDTPPPGHADAARVRVNAGVSDDQAAAAAANAAASADANKPKDAAKPAPAPGAALDRAAACEQARSNLNLLQSKYQVADASGKPLDDKTRQTLTDQAKQTVADCAKP
jgi:hypothetical protein